MPSSVLHAFPISREITLAERVGFEPTVSFPTHAFQACRFGRSRTPPRRRVRGVEAGDRTSKGDCYPAPADRARWGVRGALYPKSTYGGLNPRPRPEPE